MTRQARIATGVLHRRRATGAPAGEKSNKITVPLLSARRSRRGFVSLSACLQARAIVWNLSIVAIKTHAQRAMTSARPHSKQINATTAAACPKCILERNPDATRNVSFVDSCPAPREEAKGKPNQQSWISCPAAILLQEEVFGRPEAVVCFSRSRIRGTRRRRRRSRYCQGRWRRWVRGGVRRGGRRRGVLARAEGRRRIRLVWCVYAS